MRLGETIEDFEIETIKGKYNYYDFSGFSLIIAYGGKDSGVGLTEMSWLNRHIDGLTEFGINPFAIYRSENIEEIDTNVRLMSGDAVMFPIVNADIDLIIENEKTLYLTDKENKIVAIMSYPLNIGFSLIEMFRVHEASQLKKVGLHTPCNWLGMNEMTWEDKEIAAESLTDKDVEMRFGKHTEFATVRFVKRELEKNK